MRYGICTGIECSCAVKKLKQDKGSQGYRYTV